MKTVGIAIELHWNRAWHLDCFQGIVDYGEERGWSCITDPYLAGINGNHDLSSYDGVVGRINPTMTARVIEAGLPAVSLLHKVPMPSVRADTTCCAVIAGEHLVECGYSSIGCIDSPTSNPNREMQNEINEELFQDFSQAVQSHGLSQPVRFGIDTESFTDPESSMAVRQELVKWVLKQSMPIGLFIHEVETARYLTGICNQLGLRIPEDIGMLVYCSDQLTATSIKPMLSSIEMDHWEQGYQAAMLLDQLMQGRQVESETKLITEARVIQRDSTSAFITEDQLVANAMRYISENSSHAISPEDVAAELKISRRTLDRRFEMTVGKTVSQVITQKRMQYIKTILEESDMTMSRIAEFLHFSSPSQFTQFFKKHAGVTPTIYRETNKLGR